MPCFFIFNELLNADMFINAQCIIKKSCDNPFISVKLQIVFSCQLIDAITGRHVWSERYDRDLKEIFALQDEIALKIMTSLQVKLTEGEYASAIAGSSSNLKALEAFWRAEEHYIRLADEDNKVARQLAEKAIDLDPNFAGAWALLGWTHFDDARRGWTKSPVQSFTQAGECARKAIALDQTSAKAYALVGALHMAKGNYDEAIEYEQKAVALNPNDPIMLTILSGGMLFAGRFEESIALVKKAMRLTPYYPAFFLRPLINSYILTERYEDAIATGKLLLERSRNGEIEPIFTHLSLASAYIGLGKEEEARAHAEEVLKINPNFSLSYYQKAWP
jgi:adenylate cyclase